MIPIRPCIITNLRALILSLGFPNTGGFSTSADLGIAWANASDHGEPLSPLNGFDFVFGCSYYTLNLSSVSSQTLLPTVAMDFYIVDSSGADLYRCGGASGPINAGVFTNDNAGFSIDAGSTPGNGLRGQLSISGTYSIVIPNPLLLFGSMAAG